MSETVRATQTQAQAPPQPAAKVRPAQAATNGTLALGNQRLAEVGRSAARPGAAFPGPPLGNQDQLRARRAPPVQAKCAACEEESLSGAHAKCGPCAEKDRIQAKRDSREGAPLEAARPALSGASSPLPHQDRIQSSFGRHDLSQVRTLTGGAAREANQQIGARAFTSGDRIGFRETPDAWLAAHESAHVIQQRSGMRVPGAGSGGDPWERHADGVADAVAAGRSAEPLLDEVAGGDGAAPPALQLDDTGGNPSGGSMEYGGLTLTEDRKQLRTVLEEYAAKHPHAHQELYRFSDGLSLQLGTITTHTLKTSGIGGAAIDPLGDIPPEPKPASPLEQMGTPELHPKQRIAAAVEETVQQIIREDLKWLEEFRGRAEEIANGFLDESDEHVVAELHRYGVRDPRIEIGHWYWPMPRVSGDIADNQSTRGTAMAAQGIISRRGRLYEARYKMSQAHGDLYGPNNPMAGRYDYYTAIMVEQEAVSELQEAQRDYDVYRQQVQGMFPILASFSQDDNFDLGSLQTLTALEKGTDPDAAALIIGDLGQKLVDISKVREGLKPGGEVNLWRVAKIVDGTRGAMGADKGSYRGQVLDDKVAQEQPSVLTGILIGLLQLLLVLAAPFTEGLTLIPAAAISVGTAYQEFKKYEMESALHNTDFGAAALSAEEPSLFWLAVSIVGAIADVGAAAGATLKIFRALAPAARAIKAGESAEEAAQNLARLERAAADAGGETLARGVRAEAKAIQSSGGKAVGMTVEEAAALKQAGADVAEQELKTGAKAAETLAGGEAKVSLHGDLWTCHSPCTMMRERYKDLIAREPKYAGRIKDIEDRARALPKTAEGDAGRQALANEAATLERDMRLTAAPGDWASPLKDAPEFGELAKRRGSLRPDLDTHPPGWSGWDEARFRYGNEAVDGLPKEYTFALQENGELAVRRLPGAEVPPLRFNAASGVYEVVETAEVVTARVDEASRATKALAELGGDAPTRIEAAFKERGALIGKRDPLLAAEKAGPLTPEQAAELSKLKGQINEQSRVMGEAAADGVYQNKGSRFYPLKDKPSTSGDFDRVYKVGDEYHVVEAKGGSSGLGTRQVGNETVEQGTAKYLEDIIAVMKKNPETRAAATELEAAHNAGKVRYFVVRAPIGTKAGASVINDVQIAEFMLK